MVGKRIKEYLTERGIKQTFLAQKTGLGDAVMSDICNDNRRIDCIEYYRICRALDVPLETFMDGVE